MAENPLGGAQTGAAAWSPRLLAGTEPRGLSGGAVIESGSRLSVAAHPKKKKKKRHEK